MVIPSFAVGRTQEILYFIREIKEKNLLPEFPGFEVYVDSPLAIEATNVFNKNVKGCFDEEAMELVNQGIRYVRSRTDPASFEAQSVASGMHDLFCGISGSRNAWKKTD